MTFNEAINGCQKTIYYEREEVCQYCNGSRALTTKNCTGCQGTGNIESGLLCPQCDMGDIIEDYCTQCGGSGKEESNKELSVSVPNGVCSDTILKMKEMGNWTQFGYSDLFIKLNVIADEYFERKKDDIFTNCYVPLSKAILGGKIKVQGLYSKVDVNVPPGSVDNSVVKLKGLGVNKIGDHYVRIKVVFPKRLNNDQISIFEKIAKYEV